MVQPSVEKTGGGLGDKGKRTEVRGIYAYISRSQHHFMDGTQRPRKLNQSFRRALLLCYDIRVLILQRPGESVIKNVENSARHADVTSQRQSIRQLQPYTQSCALPHHKTQ